MSVNISFKAVVDNFLMFIRDAPIFYLKPRKFFEKSLKLNNEDIAKKLIFYFLIIESLALGLISLLPGVSGVSVFVLIGVTLVDILIAVPIILILTASFSIIKHPKAFRTAIVFVLSTKIFMGLIPFIFYACFLATENYMFAFFRGVTYHAVSLFVIAGSAFIFLEKLRHRLIAIVLIIAMIAVVGVTFSLFSTEASDDTFQKMSMLYDPVSKEFIDNFNKYTAIIDVQYMEPLGKVLKFMNRGVLYDFVGFNKIREDWNNEYNKTYLIIIQSLKELDEANVQFSTNKYIFKTYLKNYLLDLDKLENKYRELLRCSPMDNSFSKLIDSTFESIKATNKSLKIYTDNVRSYVATIKILKKWWIID